jgi:hypothetical protein
VYNDRRCYIWRKEQEVAYATRPGSGLVCLGEEAEQMGLKHTHTGHDEKKVAVTFRKEYDPK